MALPKIGLYIATKEDEGMRIYVEATHGDNPDEFFLVEIADEEHVGDCSVMGVELDKEEWESFVAECGLEHQPDSYIEFCMTDRLNPNSEDSHKIYERHLEKTEILQKVFSAEAGGNEQNKLLVELFK